MLNIFPKFELVPISRYFITFPYAFRPSRMPLARTSRPGSTRMMSAASRATSTAEETEIPTSAACSEGASLIPSPMNPTTWPRCFNASRMRFFCAGDTRAKTVVSSTTCAKATSVIFSNSSPSTMSPGSSPAWLQTWAVTRSPSPVMIFTLTPSACSAAKAWAASGRSGSENVRKPARTRLFSSAGE